MANTVSPPPPYERIPCNNHIFRLLDIAVLFLLTSLVVYRLLTLKDHGFAWLLSLLCESWFTFVWLLTVNLKWNPLVHKTYPERLPQREEELPAVDMFVTTADPVLEPPIITMNTVLSLLAVDYPAHKLACYVSDDGCSPLTFYSLVETSKFAKLWVPFCNKHNVQVRAPFMYFSSDESILLSDKSLEFHQEFQAMKDEYEGLSRKIQEAAKKGIPSCDLDVFSNIERRNHPTIIKIIWENKECDPHGLPHLIYVSREKRLKHPHHYKAGAMNVLTRVSGLMTNAPFMLNVDCDMFANNPKIVGHAMCLLLGWKKEVEAGFVQSPQIFYDGLKDDPFGNQLVVMQKYMGRGFGGIQGPLYGGTGCFHRRKVIYGLCPDELAGQAKTLTSVTANLGDKEMLKIFGNSTEFIKSAAQALQGNTIAPKSISNLVAAAYQVAGCGYEYGTSWGTEVGWQYGSTTEDVLTGLTIHSRGWKSVYCNPEPPPFLGCAPSAGLTTLTQQKRWATGLLEILISRKSPIIATFTAKLQFRQCLAYVMLLIWALRSIPELCYVLLPAFCIITNSNFLPKVDEPATYGYVGVFLIYNIYTILEYLETGLSVRAWWNRQRMSIITSTSAWLFATLSVILKILGISETVFEITQKDESSSTDDSDAGRFTFDGSPIFVPGTTIVLLQILALVMALLSAGDRHCESRFGEVLCSFLVVMYFWPFLKGLFGKGKYGIPLSTICKSAVLSFSFVELCKRAY